MGDVRPVIIIGAPRSGTNMLRDVLARVPGLSTWPCDEINYIWRHHNSSHPTDELTPADATRQVRQYIRRRFARQAARGSGPTVVEKTCANSLRVAFVDAVVPEAKFVMIRRDGIDAAASAMRRWDASLDIPYLARKARYIPVTDVPYYASQYVRARLRTRSTLARHRTKWWGPRFEGMHSARQRMALDELCALQWQRCVEASTDALAAIAPGRVHRVDYESFVTQPRACLDQILHFIGPPGPSTSADWMVRDVSARSIGKGRRELAPERVERLTELIGPTQARLRDD